MNDFNKSKLYLIITIMIFFTLANIVSGINYWVLYLLSLVVFPLITWGLLEFIVKYKLK